MKYSIAFLCIISIILIAWFGLGYHKSTERSEKEITYLNDDKDVYTDLFKRFNTHLENPKVYRKDIMDQTDRFPEGSLFSLCFPAYGYANYAILNPEQSEICRNNIDLLINISKEDWVKEMIDYPMDEPITYNGPWNKHAVFWGHYGLLLACHKLAGGDERHYLDMARIYHLMVSGFMEHEGQGWLDSYPERVWVFDTIPCLLYLKLFEKFYPQNTPVADKYIEQYHNYRSTVATSTSAKFINSEINMKTGDVLVGPRGCDIAGTIAFYHHLKPEYCKKLYQDFKNSFWHSINILNFSLSGFREWPMHERGFVDMDTGPILFDIGPSASAFGLANSRIMDDTQVYSDIMTSLNAFHFLLTSTSLGDLNLLDAMTDLKLGVNQKYKYGFLIGDATVFYTSTWIPWL